MLTEKSVIDKIEVQERGEIWIRRADLVLKDGIEISRSGHRHVIVPGDNIDNEDGRVKAIAGAAWTPEVISAYEEMVAAQKALEESNAD